jgi:hypothetical protein
VVLWLFLDVLILAFSMSSEIYDPEAAKIPTSVRRLCGQNRLCPPRGTSGGGPTDSD